MEFSQRQTTRLGKLGEEIVGNFLQSKGCVLYRPERQDCAHPFDRLVATQDKRTIFIAECKTKPSRNKYHDTGIDKRHFDDYMHIWEKHRIKTYLFFVDSDWGYVYGNWLTKLIEPRMVIMAGRTIQYPLTEHFRRATIVYFPLDSMNTIRQLSEDQIQSLRALSSRNPLYSDGPLLRI